MSAQNGRPDLQNTKTVVQAYKIIVLAYRTAVDRSTKLLPGPAQIVFLSKLVIVFADLGMHD